MPKVRQLLGTREVREAGVSLTWSPGEVNAEFSTGRVQRIRYVAEDGKLVFTSIVAGASTVEGHGLARVASLAFQENRDTSVVGFRVGTRNRLEAWFEQREATLQREELVFYLVSLAREADRVEALLSENDVY